MSKTLLTLAFAAVSALPAAAQSTDRDADFNAAAAEVQAVPHPVQVAAIAAPAAAPAASSCEDAKELETTFEMKLTYPDGAKPLELRFQYAGCEEYPRNDYLPPYTERDYKGADGYGLTIVTDDGSQVSEVLLSKGKDWLGKLGAPANASLASGDPVKVDVMDHEDWRKLNARATLRNAAKPPFARLKTCEDALSKEYKVSVRDASGAPAVGYSGPGPSLVLLTATAAFYYHEDCDICAEVTKCDISTGKLTSAVTAHSVDCADMQPLRAGKPVFDACVDGL